MNPLIAGSIAGAFHVISGPDHLVAVTPLAVRRPAQAIRVGALWGAGHAVGAGALGAIGALTRSFFDVGSLSSWAEFLVGIVLCAVGTWAIWQTRKIVFHSHPHEHAKEQLERELGGEQERGHGHENGHEHGREHGPEHGREHGPEHGREHERRHDHEHDHERDHGHEHEHERNHGHEHEHVHLGKEETHLAHHGTSFGVGVLHGAAGTGHLLGVLPSLALPPWPAAMYLVSYGLAAIAAMTAFSALLGLVGKRLRPSWLRSFLFASGVVAIGLGLFWMWTGFPYGK